ncbi:Squamosa promoter-binding-like protein 12 [Platanthera guangdongensis]|uniref:Squamosa promoter-binding-like protein 12 n=1 Tax=Platanthera guangdongensis TaxID=2320717 RepID=A0ABR2LYG3_9ASPA
MEMEKASGDPFNGLKFGERIYFEDVGGGGSSSKSISAPTGKKGKGVPALAVGQHKSSRCQVEGCNLDLTGAKAYYCRHKVCGMHSKSPKVIVAGIEQRFCQQCSRGLADGIRCKCLLIKCEKLENFFFGCIVAVKAYKITYYIQKGRLQVFSLPGDR